MNKGYSEYYARDFAGGVIIKDGFHVIDRDKQLGGSSPAELIHQREQEFTDKKQQFITHEIINEKGCKRGFCISQKAFNSLSAANKNKLLGGQ